MKRKTGKKLHENENKNRKIVHFSNIIVGIIALSELMFFHCKRTLNKTCHVLCHFPRCFSNFYFMINEHENLRNSKSVWHNQIHLSYMTHV